ncbi:hypothetical protein RSSM_05996 [Rhodopirellula sallentina SM41]|uniref:Uncharacterized protein n=1 Tax=Rhodopirellula sallentina SM41 TaxID=1263870 RepID=M5U9A6_9BACT|nr:hypothetical protein RSSM_05996 [Rhodopirellula sallentina SM41]
MPTVKIQGHDKSDRPFFIFLVDSRRRLQPDELARSPSVSAVEPVGG